MNLLDMKTIIYKGAEQAGEGVRTVRKLQGRLPKLADRRLVGRPSTEVRATDNSLLDFRSPAHRVGRPLGAIDQVRVGRPMSRWMRV